ncbi:DUF4912 domain-containing protein [Paenibacillus eucommiae]|uniref:DUF4912 domain-containing protein n=1 Tax=Paenibacillus eucommiae TaxID=1355755 RepID=A0ABS4J1B4_9BACL|nr:DUF4912 domain-containing protein [Paenibacillus eucommiae]MBP1993583.1 hypothetical protein [Paenibacillus eucommiae]
MCVNEITSSLSSRTERNTLFLLLQNVTTLFAYWRLTPSKIAMILEHFGSDWLSLQPTLRLYTMTGIALDSNPARVTRQLPLYEQDSCYIQELKQGQTYVAELGIWNKQSQFIPLMRSNSIVLPAADHKFSPLKPISSDELDIDHVVYGHFLSGEVETTLPDEYDRFSAYTIYSYEKSDLLEQVADDDDKRSANNLTQIASEAEVGSKILIRRGVL